MFIAGSIYTLDLYTDTNISSYPNCSEFMQQDVMVHLIKIIQKVKIHHVDRGLSI